ncbi:MAG: hypothetical protein ACE5KE_02215 [Methanosarcinales archaeon]
MIKMELKQMIGKHVKKILINPGKHGYFGINFIDGDDCEWDGCWSPTLKLKGNYKVKELEIASEGDSAGMSTVVLDGEKIVNIEKISRWETIFVITLDTK